MNTVYFKDAERLLRISMRLTLLVAGVSKFYSHGSFFDYYFHEFTKDTLRIQLPAFFYWVYLQAIPYLEIIIALSLTWSKYRRIFIMLWTSYFISLETGHYILEEWSAVNQMIPFILLGTFAYILPSHTSLLSKRHPSSSKFVLKKSSNRDKIILDNRCKKMIGDTRYK